MAFIYNNHFVRELFDSFNYKYNAEDGENVEDAKFKAFLREILADEK